MRERDEDPYRDFYGNIYDRGREQRAPGDPPVDPPPPPDPTREPTPPPPAVNTTGTIPPGGWQAWFQTLIAGKTPSLETFKALEPELAKYGAKWETNASGNYNGNIVIPGLGSIDVAHGAGGGWDTWQWYPDNGQSGGDGAPIEVNPDYLAPFTEQFQAPAAVKPFEFNANDLYSDPSYLWRLNQGRGALENSAAARGLTNSGGTLTDILNYGQQAASQEFGNAWQRAAAKWGLDYQQNQDLYNNSYRDWIAKRDTFFANQENPWRKLYQGASLGASAASA